MRRGTLSPMTDVPLPDGSYDAFVVDARVEEATSTEPRRSHLELTITAGEHKGAMIDVTAAGLHGEEFDLLGMPATLTVAAGVPSVRIDA